VETKMSEKIGYLTKSIFLRRKQNLLQCQTSQQELRKSSLTN
jgi:hypothetical protein